MALIDRLVPITRLALGPFFAKTTGKYLFPFLTRRLADEMLFINWGYEEDPPMALPLSASDEPDRFCIQLYYRTATQVDLSGKRVLEISCGHGGGASYLVRALRPASYTGLDLNRAGIDFCQKRHNLPGLDFVQGDAENLPFPDQSFDAVINIEASHLYPQFPRFLAEVARVLRPGGHFLYADLRPRPSIAEWEAALADAPIRQLTHADISAEVVRGNEKVSERYQAELRTGCVLPSVSPRARGGSTRRNRYLPAFLRGVAAKVGHAYQSWLHRMMQGPEYSYRMYCFARD
jgi:ubiquinone/menaquinone biosynthesis C-methylase UbiE